MQLVGQRHRADRPTGLPRTVIGHGEGAALAEPGAIMQAVTRNALADPGILGITRELRSRLRQRSSPWG
ncbi:iron chelate uptake ABC transporter family permease subunit [Streptomyces bathyalis]|uniref:iron chelate uptake ABC transporter family permease subunit n=1 Tax=Streptomyces bathyalis TaxID=2710756 RepID=UPI003CCE0F33